MRLYRFLRKVLAWLVPRLMRFRPHGLENIPEDGPFIIAANHIHALDPVIVAIIVPQHVSFMAKEEVLHSPILGWLVKQVGSFTVKRGKADIQAIRQALKLLARGQVLGIFPEGTRSKTGEMQAAFEGTALLAARSQVPILPVALHGRYRIGSVFCVNVGEPLYIECAVAGKPTAEERAQGTEMIMQRIAALLAECRGGISN
ncbi:MAG TPA: 1-acyl-sn-glycerol-3-phosphate acyltransferase [Firmicutes bacterium]|nr:1-acyl-sn-glycerol-3-phosphate acyltransferase [Bacillota bacterium]